MKAACSFPDCGRTEQAKGLCASHYTQSRRGMTLRPVRPQRPGAECSFDGCALPVKGQGLCNSHRAQLLRRGELAPLRRPLSAYVEDAVKTRERGSECWLDWPGHRNPEGRPVVNPPKKRWTFAYRYAFFLVYGEWPNWACHRCPTHPFGEDPRCWNPAHVYNGDCVTNGADRARHKDARRAAKAAS